MKKFKMISILVVVAMAIYACGNNSEKEETQEYTEGTESTVVIESESFDTDDFDKDIDEDIDDAIDTYNKAMDATEDLLETAKELESLADDDADYEDAMKAAEKSMELSKQALDLMESMD